MATTPTLRAKLDSGAWTTGAITATYSQTVSMSLASTAGFNGIRWEIYGFPPSWPCPSGWTEDPDNRIYYAITDGSSPDPWDLPASGTWGKWLLAAYPTGDASARDIATAIEIVSPNGLHATPAHEGAQFGGAYEAWGKHVESNWRVVDAGLGGGDTAILAANEAALTAADDGSIANGTRAYVASHRSTWHLQTSDGTGLTVHERIAGSTDGRVWQRELIRSAYYELQPEWWVDPNAGDDQATGADNTHPIKTMRELLRRVAPTGCWYVQRSVTVNVGNNYVGNTLPDVVIYTGTGAVTVSFVGWEANPTVHTAYTTDSVVAPDPATNQRDTATMTAAVSDWTVGDIVRNETAGGDAYHVIGYIDGGVPERAELCQGTDSLGGSVSDPSVSDVLRRVELAPLTLGGLRVIGGATVKMSLLSVDSANKASSVIDGVVFNACKLANVRLGRASAASGCSFGGGCGVVDCHYGGQGTAGEPGTLSRCYLGSTLTVHSGNVDLTECYITASVSLQRGASAYAWGPNQVRRPSGSVFDWNDFGVTIDLSQAYSLYGSADSVFAVGGQVCGGMIRMLTDGTSVSFASGTADFVYASTGDDPQLFYPRPGSTAGNYPGCSDIINCANWTASPFNGQIARNFYCDLMIVPVEAAS